MGDAPGRVEIYVDVPVFFKPLKNPLVTRNRKGDLIFGCFKLIYIYICIFDYVCAFGNLPMFS